MREVLKLFSDTEVTRLSLLVERRSCLLRRFLMVSVAWLGVLLVVPLLRGCMGGLLG